MRTVLLVIVVLLASVASAQVLATDSSYASGDTTSWIRPENSGDLILWVDFKDSANVKIAVDYIRDGAVNYATYWAVSDSTNSTNATGFYAGYSLRRGTTNNIPGANKIRLRIQRLSTRNGVTTPTYNAGLDDE
jgi:hypothetical protein